MSEVHKRYRELMERRPDLKPALIAAHMDMPQSTALHWMGGRENLIASPRLCRAFTRILDQIEMGDILQPGRNAVTVTDEQDGKARRPRKARDLYLIETVRKVGQVLNYCGAHGLIGIVTGDYGVGKTEAVQYWRTKDGAKIDHLVVEFDDFTSRSVRDFLAMLAEHFGIPMPANKRLMLSGLTGWMFRAICDYLRENPTLLIFDQCEAITPRVGQVIRQIWDRTRQDGVGVVMLSSPLLLERLQKQGMADLGALSSRVSIWAQLQGVSRAEAADIVAKEGVATIEPAALDLLCRASGGSMRRLMAITRLLTEKHSGRPITERTIEGAAQNLWGISLAGYQRTPMAVVA